MKHLQTLFLSSYNSLLTLTLYEKTTTKMILKKIEWVLVLEAALAAAKAAKKIRAAIKKH